MSKATDAEITLRIRAVTRLVLHNRGRAFIIRYASEKWGLSERWTEEMISRANDEILKENKTDIVKTKTLIIRNQWDIFYKAIKTKNLFLARQMLLDIAKIEGLEKATLVIEDRALADLTEDELKALEVDI